ncbi:MAG: hypothetical protein D4R76_07940 [Methylococcus sp.]|nr:MAG: hypothetical protein D4R76_07940 [Methylococcus sp.]
MGGVIKLWGMPQGLCYFTHRLSVSRKREDKGTKVWFFEIYHPQGCPKDRFYLRMQQPFLIALPNDLLLAAGTSNPLRHCVL